jgi:AcrR family transcriptional regulator
MATHPATHKLARSDWTQAAIDMLIANGIDAVQITRLANHLKVTRGSFYWHFTDRSELLNAVLDEWRERNGNAIKTTLNNVDSLSEAILEFFAVWVDNPRFSPALDQSIRDWAQLDKQVFENVGAEDQQRIRHISQCYQRFGFEPQEALVRARVLYFAQIGYYAMHMEEPMQDRLALLQQYYTAFTGRKLRATVTASFIKRFEGKS